MAGPSLVLLHFFGSSRNEWGPVAHRLRSAGHDVIAIDLPGFGDRAADGARDVAGMADAVTAAIEQAAVRDCVVVGHSMSGKVATVLASRRPAWLRGLVLVAASPPSPEPMSSDARAKLRAFDGSHAAAADYLDGLTAKRLPDDLRDVAIADAMRASPEAWRAWVDDGSREDWSSRVGTLALPACVIAATQDPSLGADVQRDRVLPHFRNGTLVVVEGGHALPLDNPDAVVDAIVAFVAFVERIEQQPSSTERIPS